MTQVLEQRTYTREEYLEVEMASEERHEYVNGEIRLMRGGTPVELAAIAPFKLVAYRQILGKSTLSVETVLIGGSGHFLAGFLTVQTHRLHPEMAHNHL